MLFRGEAGQIVGKERRPASWKLQARDGPEAAVTHHPAANEDKN